MKDRIISEIKEALAGMNIQAAQGGGSDLVIETVFVDAGWSTGKKKISYEAAVYANENENTVYMYEKTTETGQGLSFGSGSGTTFQSGKTLFKKVKSIQYGPDGKAYEYTLDLGAIPKAVKAAALGHGWKFKTVINRKKAMGDITDQRIDRDINAKRILESLCPGCGAETLPDAKFCNRCGHELNAVRTEPQPVMRDIPQKPVKSKKGFPFMVIVLGLLAVAALIAVDAGIAGWVAAAAVYILSYLVFRKAYRKGCLLSVFVWLISAALLFFTITAFSGGEVSFTTAKIRTAQMTTALNTDGSPTDKVTQYTSDAPLLAVSAELVNAPQETEVTFVWIYLTGDVLITEFTTNSGTDDANVYMYSTITNDRSWPEGEYAVEIYVSDREAPDFTVNFKVVP